MPSADPPSATNLQPSDAELLSRVVNSDKDPAVARSAQAAFYARHVRYLYGVLRKQRSTLCSLAAMSVEDLVQETFRRCFEKAHTYSPDLTLDGERAQRRTRAWLGRIAHHLLVDAIEARREVAASPFVERLGANEEGESPQSTPLLRAVRAGLASLSEREQDVLAVTALYQRVGQEHQRLPNAVAEDLARRWTISQENVRAIRSRALKKLRSFVAARGAEPGEAI